MDGIPGDNALQEGSNDEMSDQDSGHEGTGIQWAESSRVGTPNKRHAEQHEIDIAELALLEGMAPLEAGFVLRDLGLNFPTTMDALRHAEKKLGILRRSITHKPVILEIGGCPKPAGAGFNTEEIDKAEKMEIVDFCTNSISPYRMFYLRDKDNKIISASRVNGSNII